MWAVAEALQLNSSSCLVNLMSPCKSQPDCCTVPQGSLTMSQPSNTQRTGLSATQRWWCPPRRWCRSMDRLLNCAQLDIHTAVHNVLENTVVLGLMQRAGWNIFLKLSQKFKIMTLVCYQGLHGCHDEDRGEIFLKISAIVMGGRSLWQLQTIKETLAAAFLSAVSLRQG